MHQLNSDTGTGASKQFKTAFTGGKRSRSQHALQITSSAVATVLVVDLEGSLDGDDWFQLYQHTFTSVELAAKAAMALNINPQPVDFVRSNVITNTGGGTITTKYEGE